MTKFKMVRLYKEKDIPHHLLEEIVVLTENLVKAMKPILINYDDSIVLSAFNRLHAALICSLVTEEGLKESAQNEAIALMKNIEHISGQKFFEETEND